MSKTAKILLALFLLLNLATLGFVVKSYTASNDFWKAHEETHGNLIVNLPRDFTDKVDAIGYSLEKIYKENVALNELRSLPDPDVDGVLGADDLCPWDMSILRRRQEGSDYAPDGDLDRNGCLDAIYWMEPDVAFTLYQVENEDGTPAPWPNPSPTMRGGRGGEDDDFLWWYWDNVRRIDGKEYTPFGLQCRALRGDDLVTLGEMATAPSTNYGSCAVYEGKPDGVPSKYLKK